MSILADFYLDWKQNLAAGSTYWLYCGTSTRCVLSILRLKKITTYQQ